MLAGLSLDEVSGHSYTMADYLPGIPQTNGIACDSGPYAPVTSGLEAILYCRQLRQMLSSANTLAREPKMIERVCSDMLSAG
jgi:hypothetical protein